MSYLKIPKPPDGDDFSEDDLTYEASQMDTTELGVVIKRINNNVNAGFKNPSNILSSHSSQTREREQVPLTTSGTSGHHISNNSPEKENVSNKPVVDIKDSIYGLSDVGPFIIILESIDNNLGNLHPMAVGKLILEKHRELNNFIDSIATAGRNKIRITFKSAYHANMLLKSAVLKEKNMKAYIPQYLTRRIGVIRNVDFSLTNEEIKAMISPLYGQHFSVIDVQRLNRRIIKEDKSADYKPTSSVKITFKGQILPSKIELCKVICLVEPFVQRVVQCYNCLRYGHVSNQCRSKVRCNKCGNEHKSEECNSINPPCCIFCKGNHSALNHKDCPEFAKQKTIKTIMATENISHREATEKQQNSFATITKSPIRCTPEEFPSLFEHKKRKLTSNNISRPTFTPENIHKDPSGNGVCLSQQNKDMSFDKNTYATLIEKLVSAVMQLSKNENLKSEDCEIVIKKIVESLINFKFPSSN